MLTFQLKIMITSRFKLANPKDMADEASNRKVELRLGGAVREYSIPPLDKADAMTLLDHELGGFVKVLYQTILGEKDWSCNYIQFRWIIST